MVFLTEDSKHCAFYVVILLEYVGIHYYIHYQTMCINTTIMVPHQQQLSNNLQHQTPCTYHPWATVPIPFSTQGHFCYEQFMNNQANNHTPTKILGKMRMWILMKKTKSQRRERKLTCQDVGKNQQALLNILLAMMMLMRMLLCIFEFQLVLLITFLFCATKATPVVATHIHSYTLTQKP